MEARLEISTWISTLSLFGLSIKPDRDVARVVAETSKTRSSPRSYIYLTHSERIAPTVWPHPKYFLENLTNDTDI